MNLDDKLDNVIERENTEADTRAAIIQQYETLEHLKEDINKFLWTRLPDKMTLEQADDIAVRIYNTIFEQWEAT